MKPQTVFYSRIGDRWNFAIEFEGVGDPPKTWNEWWSSLWLWINGHVVGRPSEIEMLMTGFGRHFLDSTQCLKTKIILGKKSAWWNRQLKGWWMLGGPIGFFIGGILTSAWLRWSLLLLSVLGCLFAIGFRLARGRDEI